LHLQANLCKVIAEDKKQKHCGDFVLGWAEDCLQPLVNRI